MGWKRKSTSTDPQPNPAKAPKRKSFSRSPFSHKLSASSWMRKISTPTKRKSWTSIHTLFPQKHVQQCDSQEQKSSADLFEDGGVQSSTPVSSPLLSEEDAELGLVITVDEDRFGGEEWLKRKNGVNVKKSVITQKEGEIPEKDGDRGEMEEGLEEKDESEEDLRKLDRDLTLKSKKLNLSSVNVRNIIHEVVTNEHVVAMMKAAIRDTQDMPMFEPKMTRSKLKEVVEKGVGMGNWNISPIKKTNEIKPPQFVDIPLQEEEDSSDEEYCPDEDEEDETAEETFMESDVDSTGSSPHGSRHSFSRSPSKCDDASNSPRPKLRPSRHLRVEAVPMGPPAPPPQSCGPSRSLRATDPFIEKLHAVDKELELSPLCMEPYQTLSNSGGGEPNDNLVACRTRSKRPLRDIPLDQLEAELRAPDITPDMYDNVSTPEDREWTQWLQGLMTSHLDNEEEGDEDDDPEYNFLDDLDEPDLEDYRNDRAVRITKREVNELMEELFETFNDELAANELDEEGHEEDEEHDEEANDTLQFNVPQAIRFEEPLAHMLTACRRTVREQMDTLQQRRENQARATQPAAGPGMVLLQPNCPLVVTSTQRVQLQQQIQQHVQLLTQVNMLCSYVGALQSETQTTKLFLSELLSFAERAEEGRSVVNPGFRSMFRVCNLQPSLNLLDELKESPSPLYLPPKPTRRHAVRPYPFLPAGLAWLFATRSVFLYPELIPHCSLDPALHAPRSKYYYSKGEDSLIVLGLKHFAQTEFPYQLMSQYLIRPKRQEQLRVRVKDMASSRAPHNIIKFYCQNGVVPPLPVMCRPVLPGEEHPPVEREQNVMPNWLRKSLPHIHRAVSQTNSEVTSTNKSPAHVFPKRIQYPQFLPKGISLRLHPSRKASLSLHTKARPLHGFSRPALLPLAKAPICPTGTGNLLTSVSTAHPSRSVILLAQGPSTPANGVLPLVQTPLAPAHGTVPLSTPFPINFQYVTPELGSCNPAYNPANLPPTLVQMSPSPSVDSPFLTTRMVKTCCKPRVQQMSDKRKKQTFPRKLAPLKPATQLPQLLPLPSGSIGSLYNSAVVMDQAVSLNFTPNFASDTTSTMVVIDPSSTPAKENARHLTAEQRLVTSSYTPPLQDLVIQLVPGTQALENTLSRTTLAAECNFLQTLKDTLIQNSVENGQRTINHNSGSLMTFTSSVPSASSRILSPLTAAPAEGSQFVLVQTVSHIGEPQFLLLPNDSIVLNQTARLSAEDAPVSLSMLPQQQTACSEIPTSSIVLNNTGGTEVPLNIKTPATSLPVRDRDARNRKEGEEEEMGGDRWEEEMASALFGSPLLALSESSSSPEPSLTSTDSSTDGGAEATDGMERDNRHSSGGDETRHLSASEQKKQDSVAVERQPVQSGSDTQETPGVIKHSTGDGKEQHSSGGEKQNNGNEGDGQERQREERESGGDEERDGDKEGEKNGDEGGSGNRDGNGSGDKGREEKDGDGEKDRDGERDEEEEDFDDLTQDEDEEEVMSSASEESVLSVPELQETMEKLTWLASERRLCREGDSDEENSPTSPTSPTSPNSQNSPASQNSQEENSEDEEDGVMKGDEMEAGEGDGGKLPEGDAPPGDDPPQTSGRGGGRGKGRGRPPSRSLKRCRRQERGSKDAAKLFLLYDDHILDNDPMRESKDMAFAQAYLSRVREALQDAPGKVEEFFGLLYEFDQAGNSRSIVELFSQLKPLLRDWPDLLKDFAAFLLPEQALECGLFEEQQSFERSRRFLRQLEISFGENPSHYQKIVRALQSGTALNPAGIEELKAQMATLLKGHTHLQGEFWMFFDEMRPPPARPGQFEEALWPEDVGTGTDGEGGINVGSGEAVRGGFEEVTLPDLEEDEESHKIRPISNRSKRRKEMRTHGNYKDCDWPEKDCSCPCHDSSHDAKHRRHKRKGCLRCHSNKATNGSKVLKSRDSAYPSADTQSERGEDKDEARGQVEDGEAEKEVKDESGSGANSPHNDGDGPVWEGGERHPSPVPEEQEKQNEEDEEKKDGEGRLHTISLNDSRDAAETGERDAIQQSTLSPALDTPVCAKNISLTPSGEKVILWTREADRVILTTCQQQGASQSTFQAVSEQLGNKTASEVSQRFRDLMRLFHTSACQASSEDEATEQQSATDEEQD
ncbi:GON-4-like protein isoform X2 [Myxocyprinus asiaticus]|uniref:GON-4-like protein isoform X2 n=1 Tax=Myxocyprinus asiaticus TaxID=70543 RepID=UPI002221D89E|nr:GON-4-like protein isoform X2 [Myxocyprinus asiaticus]